MVPKCLETLRDHTRTVLVPKCPGPEVSVKHEKEHKIWGLCSVRFDDKGSVLFGFFIDGIGNGLTVSIS